MHPIRLSLLFIALTLLLCGQITNQAQVQPPEKTEQKTDFPSGDAFKNAKITYNLIPGINKTWGYDILVDNKMKIHQPCIPGLPGNKGFKTKIKAEKVAKLAIEKMNNGEKLPSITTEELKKLDVI